MSILDELEQLDEGQPSIGGTSAAIDTLEPDPDQPRTHFDDSELQSLADSLAERGILQPIIVRPLVEGRYVIVAGERRWRAAKLAGLGEVPIVVRDQSDSYDQMVENIQRADLRHSEIAKWIVERLDDGEKAADIARRLGRSKVWVSRYASFKDMPSPIADRVDQYGMETAQVLTKAWMTDSERTAWFLNARSDITRDGANEFLKSLVSGEGGTGGDDHDPVASLGAPVAADHHHEDDVGDIDSVAYSEVDDSQGDDAMVDYGSETDGIEEPSGELPVSPKPTAKSGVEVHVTIDQETQRVSVLLDGRYEIEVADGETNRLDDVELR